MTQNRTWSAHLKIVRFPLNYIHINDVSALDGFMAWMPSLFCHQLDQTQWALIFTQSQFKSWPLGPFPPSLQGVCPIQSFFTRIPLLAILWPPLPVSTTRINVTTRNYCEASWDILGPFLTLTMAPWIVDTKYHTGGEDHTFCAKIFTTSSHCIRFRAREQFLGRLLRLLPNPSSYKCFSEVFSCPRSHQSESYI